MGIERIREDQRFKVLDRGVESGPFDRPMIRGRFRRGEISPEAKLCCDGLAGWHPIHELMPDLATGAMTTKHGGLSPAVVAPLPPQRPTSVVVEKESDVRPQDRMAAGFYYALGGAPVLIASLLLTGLIVQEYVAWRVRSAVDEVQRQWQNQQKPETALPSVAK